MIVLRCFGSAVIADEDGRELTLRSRKHLALLLYVAVRPKTLFTRDELASFFWNGTDRRSRHSLSQALYDIGSILGQPLRTTNVGVQLVSDVLECEATRFHEAVERHDYDTAIALYRGPFAPNLANLGTRDADHWIESERDRFQILAGLAFRGSLHTAEQRGDWDRACFSALRLLQVNPFDETAHRALMRGLWMKGDAPSALTHYDRSASRFRRIGLDGPSQSTTELAAAIRQAAGSAQDLKGRRAMCGRQSLASVVWRKLRTDAKCAVLVGERGMGKTTLAQHFATLAQAYGISVIDASAATSRPSADKSEDAAERARERSLTTTRPHQSSHNMLLIADDAHRIDAAQARDVIEHAQLNSGSLLVTVDIDAMVAECPPLLAQYVLSSQGPCIAIPPLSEPALSALVHDQVSDLPDQAVSLAVRASGGNPLYAIDLALATRGASMVALEVIDLDSFGLRRVRGLLERRLAHLDPISEELLRLIAILGGGVSDAVLKGIMRKDVEIRKQLELLARRRLIERKESDNTWSVCVPLLEQYVCSRAGSIRCAALHRVSAEIYRGLAGNHRLRIATHLAAAGDRREAHREAVLAVDEGIREGRVSDAARAAELAAAHAQSVRDRLRARLALGELQLARGSHQHAQQTLLPLLFESQLTESERLSVNLALAGVALSLGARHEAQAWGAEARRVLNGATTESKPLLLRLLTLEFQLAIGDCGDGDVTRALDEMGTMLSALKPQTDDGWGAWCNAWQVYLPYLLDVVSIGDARLAVTRYSTVLSRVPSRWGPIGLASRGLVAVREGHLGLADRLFCEAVERLPPDNPSRLHSLLLNNLAVSQLEQGRFDRAKELLVRCHRLDRSISAPPVDAVIPLLNMAARCLYEGRFREGEGLCKQVLELLGPRDDSSLHSDANACLQLLALARGRRSLAEAVIQARRTPFGYDRLKVAWLEGFVACRRDPNEGAEILATASETARAHDVVAAMKLALLADLAQQVANEGRAPSVFQVHGAENAAGSSRLTWFSRVAVRWWRAATRGVETG